MALDDGFFDLQVNGYAGVDFNDDALAADALHAACLRLRDDGVAGILATVITDELNVMAARLQNLVELRTADPLVKQVVAGIHIEGPFISPVPGFVGAHPVSAVRAADVDAMQQLLGAAGGLCRLVTLAPECDPQLRVTRFLADRGVAVAAGHCDPSRDQLKAAVDAGLTMFTHVGNACPMTLARHDNIIQRTLSLREYLWCCFIADGAHIPFFVLANYLRAAGIDRSIVVTDAIAAAGLGPGRYFLGNQQVEVDQQLVSRFPGDNSHLAGSAVTMPRAAENLRENLGLDDGDIRRLTRDNPRRAIAVG